MADLALPHGSGTGGDPAGFIHLTDRFALINRMILRDINRNTDAPKFSRYSKENINTYLSDPNRYEKQLRDAIIYIYGASPHFRRLVQYFAALSDFSYVVSPFRIDPKTANAKTVGRNYRKVLNTLSSMNIKTQFPNMLTVCMREDVYYGTMHVTSDSIMFQQLPSDYCTISTVENNVPNVTFNFSYFTSREYMLSNYPEEFRRKYELYKKDRANRWIELDSPTSFAVKCNRDILAYALPPFAGLLRDIYDIEDYRNMKLTKTALENYAMIVMNLPMKPDGEWGIDLNRAKDFWSNLDSVLPEEVGSILTPMKVEKIGFEKSNTGDTDAVAEAEQNMFTAAGVSSLLFNNPRASAGSLLLSIKADQAITFGVVKGIQDVVNRYIQSLGYGKNFHIEFLDCSPFNRKELGDAYLKAASYGMPTISMYCASQGLGQAELDNMSFLETTVLGLQDLFRPLISSSQMSATSANKLNGKGATDEGGAPVKEAWERTDSGEESAENKDDWG